MKQALRTLLLALIVAAMLIASAHAASEGLRSRGGHELRWHVTETLFDPQVEDGYLRSPNVRFSPTPPDDNRTQHERNMEAWECVDASLAAVAIEGRAFVDIPDRGVVQWGEFFDLTVSDIFDVCLARI